jgi:LytR cell envelope-related transcriptional attenuator
MANRQAISAVTIVVLIGLLVVGAVVGWRTLSAPLPGEDDEPRKASGQRCNDGVTRGDVVRTEDITVSVYNAGSRSGLADQTQSELVARDFIPGDVGNAPVEMESVRFVRVLAPTTTDPAARLVALQFGEDTLVQATEEDLGPGVEVIVGDSFQGLVEAPTEIKARTTGSGC